MPTLHARPHSLSAAREPAADYLVFRLDEREYCLPLADVAELRHAGDVHPGHADGAHQIGSLPRAAGELPVFDLRRLLDLPTADVLDRFEVIVVRGEFAIAVDSATDVVALGQGHWMPITRPARERSRIRALARDGGRVLRLVDLPALADRAGSRGPARREARRIAA